MLYLIDANVIITAKDSYYGIEQVPEFWDWLVHHAVANTIKTPTEIWEEVSPGTDNNDPFYQWRRDPDTKAALVLDEGYGPNLTDEELMVIGADPFLVAYALAGDDRLVVSTETPRPSAQRQNRKLPDVCHDFGIDCRNTFQLTRELNFSTSWSA